MGVAGDGRIRYLSGPLVKVSSMVKKVDLHKRTAEVETSFMGEKHVLYLGIELPGDCDRRILIWAMACRKAWENSEGKGWKIIEYV